MLILIFLGQIPMMKLFFAENLFPYYFLKKIMLSLFQIFLSNLTFAHTLCTA